MRNVRVDAASGCWVWTGRRSNVGYAVMTMREDGKIYPRQVHRISWAVFHGRAVPAGRVVAHDYRCISCACVNPDHLRATTQAANIRDKRRAERWRLAHLPFYQPPKSGKIRTRKRT